MNGPAFRLVATSRLNGAWAATLSSHREGHWETCGVFMLLPSEWPFLAALLRDHIEVITDGEIPAETAAPAEAL